MTKITVLYYAGATFDLPGCYGALISYLPTLRDTSLTLEDWKDILSRNVGKCLSINAV